MPTVKHPSDLSRFSSQSIALAVARGLLPDEVAAAERSRRRRLGRPWDIGGPTDPHSADMVLLSEWVSLGILTDDERQAELRRRMTRCIQPPWGRR